MPLELEFNKMEFNKKLDPGSNTTLPRATVVLKDYDADEFGVPLVSKRCGTFAEFTAEIDAALKKLEQIRQSAKSRFGN